MKARGIAAALLVLGGVMMPPAPAGDTAATRAPAITRTSAAMAAPDPALPGPYAPGMVTLTLPLPDGGTRRAEIHFPDGGGGVVDTQAGRCPMIAFGHAFTRDRKRYTDVGQLLASRGYLVLIADYFCSISPGCNHARNADEMIALLDWLAAQDTDPASRFFGRVDTTRRGVSGHSAGGLQALLAAARDPRILAAAPLDPVDSGGLGVAALPATRAAIDVSWAEPTACNAQASALDLYAAAPAPKRRLHVVGASHCDPEENAGLLGCGLTCGAWNRDRHERFMRAMSAWFEYWLRCDRSYEAWVFGAPVGEEVAAGTLGYEADLAPPPPAGIAAVAVGGGIAVRRDPPARCAGVSAWRVLRGTTPGGPFVPVSPDLDPAVLEWIDASPADPGVTRYYVARDRVVDFETLHESGDSAPAAAGPGAGPGEAGRAVPLLAAPGPGTSIAITFGGAACATGHTVHWGSAPGFPAGGLVWSGGACIDGAAGGSGAAVFDPGDPPPGGLVYFVVVGRDEIHEGTYGRASDGSERPAGAGFTGCDRPRAPGACAP